MTRNRTLIVGTILWVSFAIVAAIHVASGDWMGPAFAVAFVTVVVVAYHVRQRSLRTSSEQLPERVR